MYCDEIIRQPVVISLSLNLLVWMRDARCDMRDEDARARECESINLLV